MSVAAPAILTKSTSLLKKEQLEVRHERDLVLFKVGHAEERYSYQYAFNLCQDIRLHCKIAMRYAGEFPLNCNQIGAVEKYADVYDLLQRALLHDELRFSGEVPRFRTHVDCEGELIVIKVGQTEARMHWEDALKLSVWFRAAAKNAKGWAGNQTQRLRAKGHLHNATPD